MRIIGGKFKGRYLKSFKADHIRPTTDRVKESLFNILQNKMDGARVLDLFAGTGNLSIEAHSRFAKEVIAVEKHPVSLRIIFDNLKALQIEEGIRIIKQDVFSVLKKDQLGVFDVILIDPPFTEELADSVMEQLSRTQLFHESTIIAIESRKKEKLLSNYNKLNLIDSRDYGDKILSFFKPVVGANEEETSSQEKQRDT